MIPSSGDIIDLTSECEDDAFEKKDSEDDIVDLLSDNEENIDFGSGRADDIDYDYEDPINYFLHSHVSLSTPDQNNCKDDIIDLCSDNEENNDFSLCRADDLICDYEDPDNYFNQHHVSPSTPDQDSLEKLLSLEGDDFFSTSTQAPPSYWPFETKSAIAIGSEVSNLFPSVNHGSSVGTPHDSACAIPDEQCIEDVGKPYVCKDDKKTLPLLLTNGATAKPEHSSAPNAAASDSAHAIPNGQRINNVVEALYSYGRSILSSLLPSGATAKSGHSSAPYDARQFPQSLPMGIPRSFSPQSFASSHSILGDKRNNEEPTVNYDGCQRFASNGNGMSLSTMSTGPHSHRIFPPSRSSGGSFNGFENDNHVENRDFGLEERAVYEEALKHINQEREEEDVPKGVMSISLLKHQKIALAWMISKENSSHCSGGILADDQGLGKTISTIALIQRERVQQSRFMIADSHTKSTPNFDESDDLETITDQKKIKTQAKVDGPTPLDVAANLQLCVIPSVPAADRTLKTVKVELKKMTKSKPSASTLKSSIIPASGTLVVCPASVLKQWASELSVKVTESSKLSVLVYHGTSRTRDPTELSKYDVVVTTYTTVSYEVPRDNPDDEDKNSKMYGTCPELCVGNKRKQPSIKDKHGGPLARVRWFRVVLDEAQTIKNYRTQVSRACCALNAERRWCLSGTPIQNKIEDLYSYFCFLKYEPYCEFASFSDMIKNPISSDPDRGYKKLQTILRIILLRRTKETLIDGEPIIKLPPKTIQLSKIDFTQKERAFYLALEEGSRKKFKAYDAAGTIKDNYANILVLLLRLRQACNHPILLKGQQSDLIDSTSIEMAKQLPKDEVTNLLEKLESGPLVCSICSDPPENAVVATCSHVFCYQCLHTRLAGDENVCPAFLCGKNISAGSVFSPGVLKLCTLPKLESDVGTSSTPTDELSSICESSYISSKIKAAIDIINSIIRTRAITGDETVKSIPGEIGPVKAIVFSQWTGMLDLLELSLSSNHIQYRRLDGKMSLNVRDGAVKEFNTLPEVKVMIMSLKAGNLGLNMVAACHVIMLDPWWNPFAEDQAVDRAHRIGQTRPVTVSRLTVKGTVEDRILDLQEKKRKMVQSAFGEDNSSGNATRLTVEDLRYLFMV